MTTKPIVVFNLPWPDPRLSSNKRLDRRALTEVRQTAKELGFYAIKENQIEMEARPMKLVIVFFPPDARKRDLDNLYTSFKPMQDGIFEALQLDDSLIREVLLQWGPQGVGGMIVGLKYMDQVVHE